MMMVLVLLHHVLRQCSFSNIISDDCDTVVIASAWGFTSTDYGVRLHRRLFKELDVVQPAKDQMNQLKAQLRRFDGQKTKQIVGVHLRETDIPKDSRVELVR